MTVERFEVVRRASQWRGACTRCGKKRQRTLVVEHTVNPFNRNEGGRMKSREEVAADVSAELRRYQEAPRVCVGCEPHQQNLLGKKKAG